MASQDDNGDSGQDLPGRPRRASPRFQMRREVELRFQSWAEFLALYTGNVSRTGVLVHMVEAPELGEAVTVCVRGPSGTSVTVDGEVVRIEERGGPDGELGVAIRLVEPQPGALLDLLTQAHASSTPAERPVEEGRWGGLAEGSIPFVEIDEILEDRAEVPELPARGPVQQVDARRAAEVSTRWAAPRPPVVGLDFGTTTTKVAVVLDDEVVLIEDETAQGATRAAVPSVVAYPLGGSPVVGRAARAMLATEPKRVVGSVKRLMGLEYRDRLAAGILGSLACRTLAGPNDAVLFELDGREVTVPEVASAIIGYARSMAERWSGRAVSQAVLTVPVDFGPRARRELELAAQMAGLEVLAMIPEPVAAAMGCGVAGVSEATVAVYDFGGGTFDASVVEVKDGEIAVLGAAGDRWLGGDDLDEALARHVAAEFLRSTGADLHGRAEQWQKLLFACEDAKRWLSSLPEVDVIMADAARRAEGPLTLLVPVSRAAFAAACSDVVGGSVEVTRQALAQAGLAAEAVDAVLVTGGTTRVPAVREAVRALFGKDAIEGIHPEHSVVIGAAVHAAVLSRSAGLDLSRHLRIDDAEGWSVGIALADGTTEPVIRSSQRAPVTAHRLYSTFRDGQTAIRIEILAGEAELTEDNRRLGGLLMDGLPSAPAGTIDLDVYFELSSAGSLCVTAQERATGRRAQRTFRLQGPAPLAPPRPTDRARQPV